MPRPSPDSPLGRLLDAPMRPGRIAWIGLRPARRAPMRAVQAVAADPVGGLAGDRYAGGSGRRHVTLMAAEDLLAVARFLGLDALSPEALRRNVVTEGVNLLALKDRRFRLGAAVLEGTGECHPCSRLEETLGVGGYNAARGRGGITARVIEGATIRHGDEIARL